MRGLAAALAVLAVLGLGADETAAQGRDWGGFTTPSPAPSHPVGAYANGCLLGGAPLPADGVGYQVVRLSRARYYGHPALIDYVIDLGVRADEAGFGPILVADLSAPRGGPLSGHVSHQTGLDTDVWLRLGVPELSPSARDGLHSTLLVDRANFVVNRVWSPDHANLIRLAADDPRVNRIFVHAAIKIALCEMDWPDREFLRVIRPWFGHDSHMHIRLDCPQDAPHCEPQAAVPAGDGCDAELYSWIPDPDRPTAATPRPPRPRPPLPALCQTMLQDSPPP